MTSVPARLLVSAALALSVVACGAGGGATIVGTDDVEAVEAESDSRAGTPVAEPAPVSSPTASPVPASPPAGASTAVSTGAGSPARQCSASAASGALNTTGIPAAAAKTATTIFTAAKACDQATLVSLAANTTLSRVYAEPHQVFALPETDDRYRMLVQTLSQQPGRAEDEVIWPKAAADPASSYSGYTVSISTSGGWTAFYS